MPDVTTSLGLKKPLGNETVSRAAYNENLDILDAAVVKKSDFASHKSRHSTGGADALTPADIGAASAGDLASHLAEKATESQLGHIKAGSGLLVDNTGVTRSIGSALYLYNNIGGAF